MYKIYLPLIIASLTYAQSISFDEALNQTLKNNKDLQKEQLNIKLSKLDKKSIDSLELGKLVFSEEISKTNHSAYVFNSKLSSREVNAQDFAQNTLNKPNSRNNFTSKLSYDIPLFTGFKLSNQKDILALKQKALQLKYSLNKKQLSFEVLKAYNAAVVAKEFIKATTKAKEAIKFVVKSANAFHKEGLVTKIDVKQAKVYLLNTNSKLLESQNSYDLSIAYLKFLTSNRDITNVGQFKNINLGLDKLDDLYKYALANRDELNIQNLRKKSSYKNIKISKSTYYPSIYSHLEYGFNDDKLTLDTKQDYYTAMIGLNYTLFDNTRSLDVEKKQIAYSKASLDYEKIKDAIKLDLEKSLLDLKSKEKILKEKIEAKNLAFEVFEQSSLMYKNQLISMTNLLEQEANLRKNEANLIVARYQKSLAKGKLTLVLGKEFSNNTRLKKVQND